MVDYDVCVVGAGPAGLIAAGAAAAEGARVVLLERNRTPGRKLLLTGGGRCNLTNDVCDPRHLAVSYGPEGATLQSAFRRFGPPEVRRLFADLGVETKVEDGGRVFPTSDRASSVLDALLRYVETGRVSLMTDRRAVRFAASAGRVDAVGCEGASTDLRARSFILASGGVSRPETGSTGDGLRLLAEIGHSIRSPQPSLVPIRVAEAWVADLQGITVDEVLLEAHLDGRRVLRRRGPLLFTHFGLSGPMVLNCSRAIGEIAAGGPVRLTIDFFPSVDGGALDRSLQSSLQEQAKRRVRNAVASLLPQRLATVVLTQSRIAPDRPAHTVTRAERKAIVATAKSLSLSYAGLLGLDRAVVSSGGVPPDELVFPEMRSRRAENLYVVGDLVDFDRQSGGYSLQLCWTTGYLSGVAAAGG